ncbi:hypothetical protein [Spirosoma pomorum]
MRRQLFSLTILSLLACVSCKKDADVDPREQYYGTYNVLSQTSSFALDSSTPAKGTYSNSNDVLVIAKGQADKEMLIIFPTKRLTATVSDNGFVLNPISRQSYLLGTAVATNVDGDGILKNNSIDFTININSTYNGARYRDITVVRGPKQ